MLLVSNLWASNDLSRRPQSFDVFLGKAVFVDFTNAEYFITYDISKKIAYAKAQIEFYLPENGYPVFDLVEEPRVIFLNGELVSAPEVKTPASETTVRVVKRLLNIGYHRLEVELPLKNLVEFTDGGVKSAFWTTDIYERSFLERYLPASFEYDQVRMTLYLDFVGGEKSQKIFTNGEVENLGENRFKISYPEYFNVSSLFFHTVPEGTVVEKRDVFTSIDGRKIPVTMYVSKSFFGGELASLQDIHEQAKKVFKELENDYGPWPHPLLLIYNAGRGGMEYCGATITELSALGHEMFHSYFARGFMPANGNSGWLDEALASWRDKGHQSLDKLSGKSEMSNHPYYTRITDREAYTFGEQFMRLMNHKVSSQGGLKPFMRNLISEKLFSPMFVQEFISEFENFYGISVKKDFENYTFGNKRKSSHLKHIEDHPVHPKMTIEELKNYL